jgi:hypothetical protein
MMLFEVFQEVTALTHEIDPASLVKLTDTAVTFNALQRGTQKPTALAPVACVCSLRLCGRTA